MPSSCRYFFLVKLMKAVKKTLFQIFRLLARTDPAVLFCTSIAGVHYEFVNHALCTCNFCREIAVANF
jgi:hypothetical protein